MDNDIGRGMGAEFLVRSGSPLAAAALLCWRPGFQILALAS